MKLIHAKPNVWVFSALLLLFGTGAGAQTKSLKVGDAAGGALSGTYPNPGIATNAVGAAQIAPNACGPSELADTGVIAGDYSHATFSVDADGRLTAASSTEIVQPPFDFEHFSDLMTLDNDTTLDTAGYTLSIDASDQSALILHGKIDTQGTPPSVAAPECAGFVVGNDSAGTLFIDSPTPRCTVVFSTPYRGPNPPVCVVSYENTQTEKPPVLNVYPISTEGFTVNSADSFIMLSDQDAINYICLGR